MSSYLQKIMRQLGFESENAAKYYLLLAIPSFLFAAGMMPSMRVNSHYCSPYGENGPPGECYHYMRPGSRYYYGIRIHLWSCIPSLLGALIQFIPRVRQRYPVLHRWLGRVCMVLALMATATALLLGDVAFGGTWSTFTGVIFAATLSVVGHWKAWTAIRSGDIDVHRRWMLRTWAWLSAIITMRPFFAIGGILMGIFQRFIPESFSLTPISCGRMLHIMIMSIFAKETNRVNVFEVYPECVHQEYIASIPQLQEAFTALTTNTSNLMRSVPDILSTAIDSEKMVLVRGDLTDIRLDRKMAAVDITFGSAFWVALVLHWILVEAWLRNTAGEDERLRKIVLLKARNATKKVE